MERTAQVGGLSSDQPLPNVGNQAKEKKPLQEGPCLSEDRLDHLGEDDYQGIERQRLNQRQAKNQR